jgi:hypothetical protein
VWRMLTPVERSAFQKTARRANQHFFDDPMDIWIYRIKYISVERSDKRIVYATARILTGMIVLHPTKFASWEVIYLVQFFFVRRVREENKSSMAWFETSLSIHSWYLRKKQENMAVW